MYGASVIPVPRDMSGGGESPRGPCPRGRCPTATCVTIFGGVEAPEVTAVRAERAAPDLRELYERMLRIRQFEAKVDVLYRQGRVRGTRTWGTGQEAIAAGFAASMRPDDYTLNTYRGHNHTLARGAPMAKVMGELMGRGGGLMGGKGGSMHLISVEHGALGSYAIVGAHLPIAAGAAWSAQLRGSGQVTVCFFGDGTTNIGAFHEALNVAAVWKLPIVFVCENNQYMEYTPIGEVTAVAHPAADRAAAYGLESILIDGNDVEAVLETATGAVARARNGEGPSLIEAETYRHGGHSRADPASLPAGRGGQELARRTGDALPSPAAGARHGRSHARPGRGGGSRRSRSRSSQGRRGCTRDAPPDTTDTEAVERRELDMAELTYRDAVAAAIAQEMERDETVVFLGEDVAAAGGVFKATPGLLEQFGPVRVRDTPIAEQAILGLAMGAAMTGFRPVAEVMFSDFFAVCWDLVANEIAKARYMSNGQVSLPLVIRSANGGGIHFGAQHSQSVENWAMMIPGLKVVAPSTPADMKGLLAAAIRDGDPVIVFEHKGLYAVKGEVPDGEHVVPLGEAAVVRKGGDATIVALAAMVPVALEAADKTRRRWHRVTVIDLRCLVPLDVKTIADSGRETGWLFTVEENPGSAAGAPKSPRLRPKS